MSIFCLDARTATNHFPGIGRYVSNLAQAMVGELAANERLLLLVDKSQSSRWKLPDESKQVLHVLTAVSPFSLAQQRLIPQLLQQYQATVYHSPYYLMPYRPGIPTILTVYDIIPQLFADYFTTRTRLLANISTWLALRRAHHLVTISEATRQDVLARYAIQPEKLTVIPLAPDPHFTPQSSTAVEKMRQKHLLPNDYVLYLGINKPHKNLVRLVEAWAQASGQRENCPLLAIAGAWDDRYPEARKRAQTLLSPAAVCFLGPVVDADLPALYSGACFFIFPSLYEGFGLPVIEAMACGTAVITSHISSLPEVAGEAALYVNPQDTSDIVQQINRFLGDPALVAEYRQKSLAQAQKFTWRDTAVTTLNLYRRFCEPQLNL